MAKFGEEVSLEEACSICAAGGAVWDEDSETHGRHAWCKWSPGMEAYLNGVCTYRCLHDPREPQGVDLTPLWELVEQLLDPQTGGFGWADEAHRRAMTIAGEALMDTLDSLPATKPEPLRDLTPLWDLVARFESGAFADGSRLGEGDGLMGHRHVIAACGAGLRRILADLPAAHAAPKTLEPGDVFYDGHEGRVRIRVHVDRAGDMALSREARTSGGEWVPCGEWAFGGGPLTTEPPKPNRRPKPATLQDCPTDGTVFRWPDDPESLFRFDGGVLENGYEGDGWAPTNAYVWMFEPDAIEKRTASGEWVPVNGREDDDG